MNIAVAGATGFVGGAVMRRAAVESIPVSTVTSLRTADRLDPDPVAEARAWTRTSDYGRLVTALEDHDAVVNAAGLATPGSRDTDGLRRANVVWPLVLSLACAAAGATRLIHVSSAAVQGRMDPLDESPQQRPFSPYSASKAAGERHLLRLHREGVGAAQLCLFRPTSVQGAGRATTAGLRRLRRLPLLPLTGRGHQPLPLSLVDNVAAATLFLARHPSPPTVALQPWEGLTTRRLYSHIAPGRHTVSVPPWLSGPGVAALRVMGGASPRLAAVARQAELLLRGQRIHATALHERGFALPIGDSGWARLFSSPI